MRVAWCLHAAMRVVVCGLGMLGSLILLGCGGDDSAQGMDAHGASKEAEAQKGTWSPEALAVAQAPFYAELDAAFPEGRPDLTTVEERAADGAYRAHRAELRAQKVALQADADAKRRAAEAHKALVVEQLRANLGAEPVAKVVEARLAQDAHYVKLDAAARAAEEAVAAKQAELAAVIRARRFADISRYEELKAASDAAACAAGVPARGSVATGVVEEPAVASDPAANVIDVQGLSKETGIPIAPSAP